MEKMFEKATREKVRFTTPVGVLSVEDLWDLPVESKTRTSLDGIYIVLNREIKDTKEESFVAKTKVNPITELKLEIVKHIITTKMEEAESKALAKAKAEKKAKILDILGEKEDEALKSMTTEELKALLNA